MRLITSLSEDLKFEKGAAVTLGSFDGVHRGHQALIDRILRAQKSEGLPSVVITFDPHPMQVLHPERKLNRLFPLEETYKKLMAFGVDTLFVIPFSREFSQLSPETFFSQYLVQGLNAQLIVVGHDFSFGSDRAGGFSTLEKLTSSRRIRLEKVEPILFEGSAISSTRIRKSLIAGQVDVAGEMLGHAFFLRGFVEKGFARGRKIGFPTANLRVRGETLPLSGVYVCRVQVGEKIYGAVTNVGINPTFIEGSAFNPVKVESHLFDFDEDIYGVEIKLEFLQRLREEQKFSSVDELKNQIQRDADEARRWLRHKA